MTFPPKRKITPPRLPMASGAAPVIQVSRGLR